MQALKIVWHITKKALPIIIFLCALNIPDSKFELLATGILGMIYMTVVFGFTITTRIIKENHITQTEQLHRLIRVIKPDIDLTFDIAELDKTKNDFEAIRLPFITDVIFNLMFLLIAAFAILKAILQ